LFEAVALSTIGLRLWKSVDAIGERVANKDISTAQFSLCWRGDGIFSVRSDISLKFVKSQFWARYSLKACVNLVCFLAKRG
jgi:hypothetical protein